MSEKTMIKQKGFISIFNLIRKGGLSLGDFLLSGILSFLAALFDGISKGLLIPLIKGVIQMDFGFVWKFNLLNQLVRFLPQEIKIQNLTAFFAIAFLIFITSAVSNLLFYFASLAMQYQITKFSNNLRKGIFSRYLDFGKSFFDKNSLGYLSNILINLSNTLLSHMLVLQNIFNELCRTVIYLAILFIISWKLTALIVLISPLIYYSLNWLMIKIKRTSTDLVSNMNSMSRSSFNVLSNIALVKAYSMEGNEKHRFELQSEMAARLDYSIRKKQGLVAPLQNMFMLVIVLLLVLIIGFVVMRKGGQYSSVFIVYLFLLKSVSTSFGSVNNIRSTVAAMLDPAAEILQVFDDKDKPFVMNGKEEFRGLRERVEFKNLKFSYIEKKPVLNDVSFSINKNEVVAIVGPSGSGKTTLINLLMRFYDFPPGLVFIDEIDIKNFTLKSLRKHLAVVSQDVLLFDDTFRNNVKYGLDNVSEERIIDVLKKARLYDFIVSLPQGLDTHIGDKGVKLSGGERQRLAIARALLKDAEVLILDEATSSLDTKTEKLIQEAIEEAVKGKTTIVIAHRLSTIKNSDKVVVIENGVIIEEGPMNILLDKKGKFWQYWEEQKFY